MIKYVSEKHELKSMITYLCKCIGVSKSGYYNYFSNENKREIQDNKDKLDFDLILKATKFKNRKKGSRQIKMVLENEFNTTMNLKKIRRLMKKYNLVCPIRKANPYRRMMKATKEHSICESLQLEISLETIKQLRRNKTVVLTENTKIHSDQGAHYTSSKFRNLLKKYNIQQSMSRRGNCWDNAPQESYFGHMKDELNLDTCFTFRDVCNEIKDYIDYYNNYRYQWGLEKMTPVKYRNHLFASFV